MKKIETLKNIWYIHKNIFFMDKNVRKKLKLVCKLFKNANIPHPKNQTKNTHFKLIDCIFIASVPYVLMFQRLKPLVH